MQTLLQSSMRSSSDVGDEVPVRGNGGLTVLDIAAKAGTSPTLDVAIQAEFDGLWFNVYRFTQKTDAGTYMASMFRYGDYSGGAETSLADDPAVGSGAFTHNWSFPTKLRAKWAIGGTSGPTFTFGVKVIPLP